MSFFHAINRSDSVLEAPEDASKTDNYVCPQCGDDVFLRFGEINRPHFAHYRDSTCHFYSNPSESQIHGHAIDVLSKKLEHGIILNRQCICGVTSMVETPSFDDILVKKEYPIKHNGKNTRCDVAILDKMGCVKMIIEIFHTHRTKHDARPEPWVELNARDILEDSKREFKCIRNLLCEACVGQFNNVMYYYTFSKNDYKPRRRYFNVLFEDRYSMKKLGGRWDPSNKLWWTTEANPRYHLISAKFPKVTSRIHDCFGCNGYGFTDDDASDDEVSSHCPHCTKAKNGWVVVSR